MAKAINRVCNRPGSPIIVFFISSAVTQLQGEPVK